MNIKLKNELERVKNSLEGSVDRQFYDYHTLSFIEYLDKYYSNSESLEDWNSWMHQFVYPAFDVRNRQEFVEYLEAVKPPFYPDFTEMEKFWDDIKSDDRFDIELKKFFSFLYSCSFFRDISFNDWLSSLYWKHPWRNDEPADRSILEILKFKNGINYLKSSLRSMPWMNRR
jgi:hypothetical protein